MIDLIVVVLTYCTSWDKNKYANTMLQDFMSEPQPVRTPALVSLSLSPFLFPFSPSLSKTERKKTLYQRYNENIQVMRNT